MSGLFEGYNYDIFISYRQNDNKYDGWVTEFAANLSKELEATIKDKVTVYFDSNASDGLLETHSVDKSLEDKLKCIIFIPILSRTFCDSKSFAWNNEFLAFLQTASADHFGINIKLNSGNVASRVLPVRIHDLDQEDLKQVESHLGHIRSVDFIYKSAGVNRPLRANEDHPHDNFNKTYYRDQINKVANAIDEILNGLKKIGSFTPGEAITEKSISQDTKRPPEKPSATQASDEDNPIQNKQNIKIGKSNKRKREIYSISSLGVILASIILFLFSSGSSLPFSERNWIVITDFENLTNDPVFDKSLYTAFTLTASQSSYVNILPRSRMVEILGRMEIKDLTNISDKTGREIALREGIALYIVPSISAVGSKYIIAAKILETKTGNLLRSEVLYAETKDEILAKLDRLSKIIRRQLGESRYEISTQDKPLSQVTTSSLEALKLFSLGIEHHLLLDFKGAKDYYESALRIDTGFTAAEASLGNLLIEKLDSVEKGRILLNRAVKSVGNLTEREKLGILALHASNVEKDIPKAIKYAKMRNDLYPDDPASLNNLGWYYQNLGQFENALIEYKAAVRINPKMAITYSGILWIYLEKLGEVDSALVWAERMISDNPQNAWGYTNLGSAWICLDSLDKAELAFVKAGEINPGLTINLYRLAHAYRLQGRNKMAIAILKNILEQNPNEASAYYDLGINCQSMGSSGEAKNYFSKFRKIANDIWMKKWPNDAGTYVALSAVTARLNEMDSSRIFLRKAIEIDSTLHDRYAEVFCIQGNINDALVELEKAFLNGYRNIFWLKLSPDLQILQSEARYRNLVKRYIH
jgi:tetratricopeptide (TPR) repeat protein